MRSSRVSMLSNAPGGGTLKVKVTHAEGLMAADSNGLSDPYVKLYFCGQQRKSKT